jgi:glucose/arabinose dehydrogenase
VTSARLRILAGLIAAVTLVAGLVVVTRDDGDDDTTDVAADDRSASTTTTRERPTTTAPTTTSSTAPPTTAVAPSTAPPTTAAPATDPFARARIRLVRIVSLDHPIAMAVRPSDGSTWIARKGGAVCRLSGGSCTNAQVVASVSTGSEQGLLGIAFNPSGSRFYASYTNPAGDSRVDELPVLPNGTLDVSRRRNVFAEDQPESNHNGGNILFGPDGRLYLGLGDGGGAGDQHGSVGNGQDPSTDLGKILRIDPAGPTVQRWIMGVRNPWRFSFDRANGDLYVADVGQGTWEEVTYLRAGAQQGRNLGWRCYEGTHPYTGCSPAGGHTGPVHEYAHGPGCSITGGYVYRGTRIPALVGAYLFADYCDGQIRGFTTRAGRVNTLRALGHDPGGVVSFGEAADGELYVLTTSAVWRIDPG